MHRYRWLIVLMGFDMITLVTRWIAGSFMLMLALCPAIAQADGGRVALVIGNGGYDDSIGALRNPGNDAKLMAQTLKKLGFSVTLAIDVNQKEMKRSIRDFGQALMALGPDGIGLFYYAGHGVQVEGVNYLLPIGAEIRNEGDVELEAIAANSVLAQMEYAPNSVNLVFLDACRNNPLTRSFRSASRGLARVDAPRGSFVGYSTAPGEVSVDGKGSNSPYTLALAEELLRPGQAIEEVHRSVRLKVLAATNEQQTPWDSSSLTAAVTLATAPAAPIAAVPAPAAPAATAPAPSAPEAERAWNNVKDSKNPAVFRAFLQQYPSGLYAALAQDRLDQLGGGAQQSASAAAATPAPAAPAAPLIAGPAVVDVEPMQGSYVAIKSANIRAEPNAKAKVIGKFKAAESVTVTGRTADQEWLQVASAAGTGFVSAQLLQADESIANRTPEPASVPESAPAPLPADPESNALKLTDSLRPEIERYLSNSKSQTGNYRFLAVNAAGDKIGVSISCKMKSSGWGGWAAEGCNDEARAKEMALSACGSNCRIIFNRAEKIGDFEIEWVNANGSTEGAAAEPVTEPTPTATTETTTEPAAPTQSASAAPGPDSIDTNILRVAASLRADIEKYLANSQSQTSNFRFLAVNAAGDKLGISTSCKMKTSGWGGWSAEGCSNEADAKRLAIEACGGDCRIIFKGADKVGDFEIEWY